MLFAFFLFFLARHGHISNGAPVSSSAKHFFPREPALDCDCPETRTIHDIVWTCATTLVLATWVSVHPSVPANGTSNFRVAILRLGCMLATTIAPEMTLLWAFQEWRYARFVHDRITLKYNGWTMVHSFYLVMGGFAARDEASGMIKALPPAVFAVHLEADEINLPLISEEDIGDKSKGDGLAKAITLGQICWFLAQLVSRLAKGWAASQLEVLTLATCVLAVGVYALWWNKPFDVRRQTIITLRLQQELGKDPNTRAFPPIPPFPAITASEEKISLTDELPRSFFQRVWVSEPKPQQCFHQQLFEPPSFMRATLNILALPFIFLFRLAYTHTCCRNWGTCAPPISLEGDIALSRRPLAYTLAATATIFGGFHFISWSLKMPSTAEVMLWRVAAIALTAIPPFAVLFVQLRARLSPDGRLQSRNVKLIFSIMVCFEWFFFMMHPLIRLIIFIDALVLLRNLPETAFLDLKWGKVIPSY